MSVSFWLDRSVSARPKTYDAVIVGAGISGLSTAYWLNREDPGLKIAILEKSRVSFGASGRNAGFITAGSVEHFNRMVSKHGPEEALEIWRFAEKNLSLLKERIIRDEGADLEFEQRGCYSLAAEEHEFSELIGVAKQMAEFKIPTEICTADDCVRNLGTKGFAGGIRYLGDATVNPVKLVQKISAEATADLFEMTEVFAIEDSGNGTRILKTDNGDFEAPIVLLNVNAYSSSLHPWFKDKIYPTRGQCLMLDAVPRFMDGPCYANFYLDYFRQTPGGQLLIGGFRQIEKQTEIGFSDHTTDVIQNALHKFVRDHLPQFKEARVSHRWAGVMGFSADGQPMIGSLPDDPQVFFAGGYTAHGIGLSFHATKLLIDLVFGKEIPRWISAKRFT